MKRLRTKAAGPDRLKPVKGQPQGYEIAGHQTRIIPNPNDEHVLIIFSEGAKIGEVVLPRRSSDSVISRTGRFAVRSYMHHDSLDDAVAHLVRVYAW